MPDPVDPVDPASPADSAVRRLLAAARADGPPPPDVVERLDRVLAELRDQRDTGVETGPAPRSDFSAAPAASHEQPPDLTARRRRRTRLLEGLVAASVAVAVLAGAGPVLRGLSGGGDTASDSSGGAGSLAEDGGGFAAAPEAALPSIRPGRAASDIVERVPPRARALSGDASREGIEPCVAARSGQSAVAVTYGGRLAALVFATPTDRGAQRVTVYACDGVEAGTRLRRLTLRAP